MQPQYPPINARSYSTPVFGRCISSADRHHWVMDHATWQDGPGDQPGPIEHFLSGVTACGVLMVERQAKLRDIPLRALDVRIEAVRKDEAEIGDGPATLKTATLWFELDGPSQEQAEQLVDYYRRH